MHGIVASWPVGINITPLPPPGGEIIATVVGCIGFSPALNRFVGRYRGADTTFRGPVVTSTNGSVWGPHGNIPSLIDGNGIRRTNEFLNVDGPVWLSYSTTQSANSRYYPMWSNDLGMTWNFCTGSVNDSLNLIVYNTSTNTYIGALGSSEASPGRLSGLVRSTEGISWTRPYQGSATGSITCRGTSWLAANGYLLSTDNGVSWIVNQNLFTVSGYQASSTSVRAIASDENFLYAVMPNGTLYSSPTGAQWTLMGTLGLLADSDTFLTGNTGARVIGNLLIVDLRYASGTYAGQRAFGFNDLTNLSNFGRFSVTTNAMEMIGGYGNDWFVARITSGSLPEGVFRWAPSSLD